MDKLKARKLWDNTLLLFTTDNGGSLALDETAGNNYPLRGGKGTKLEGGIRGTAFVNGGYLPDSRRGQKETGLMSIADWYVRLYFDCIILLNMSGICRLYNMIRI